MSLTHRPSPTHTPIGITTQSHLSESLGRSTLKYLADKAVLRRAEIKRDHVLTRLNPVVVRIDELSRQKSYFGYHDASFEDLDRLEEERALLEERFTRAHERVQHLKCEMRKSIEAIDWAVRRMRALESMFA
ncbi:MAG: hypothetical protein M1828_006583 [Chrysothrix sp. TS-e1954]|nr:MAG: hypothetical protein M1828_006583 [Chrysothrix sp. TS-e1954]